jgi:hypothetical protein
MIELPDRVAESLFVIVIVTAILSRDYRPHASPLL